MRNPSTRNRGPVLQTNRNDTRAQDFEGGQIDRVELQLRYGARMRHRAIVKGVAERLSNDPFHVAFRKQRHRMAQVEREQPQVVQSENVVGMGVCEQHAVHDPDPLAEQLGSQVGRRVDEQVPTGQSGDHGAARPLVAGLAAGADGAITPDHRHTHGSARSQQHELTADILAGGRRAPRTTTFREPIERQRVACRLANSRAEPQGRVRGTE